jgi:hypothetical protein
LAAPASKIIFPSFVTTLLFIQRADSQSAVLVRGLAVT